MENNPKEGNKYLEIFRITGTGSWVFNKQDLDYYSNSLKKVVNSQGMLENSSSKLFLSELKVFIGAILQNCYTKHEAAEVVDFFLDVLESFIEWFVELTLGELGKDSNLCIFQISATIVLMIIGVDENSSNFHGKHRKTTPKKYKTWDRLVKKSNLSPLSTVLLSTFGKKEGFSLFTKIILSK